MFQPLVFIKRYIKGLLLLGLISLGIGVYGMRQPQQPFPEKTLQLSPVAAPVSLSGVMPTGFVAQPVFRDPFQQPGESASLLVVDAETMGLRLWGVVNGDSGAAAIIESATRRAVYRSGDIVDGYQITEIRAAAVVLTRKTVTYVLQLRR